MATIKIQEQFNQRVDALLLSLKAQKQENGRQRYHLSTKVGNVEISVHEPMKTRVFSVFCLFYDLEKAKPVMEVYENFNPNTGKFNFHYMDSDLLLQVLENDLEILLN